MYRVPPIQNPINGVGQISYSGKNAKQILDWLYKDSDYLTRLDRKYKRYLDYFYNEKGE